MSTQIKKNGNWVTVAGGTRMWVGTKAALQAALDAGELVDGTAVMVTDDYEEESIDIPVTLGSNFEGLVKINKKGDKVQLTFFGVKAISATGLSTLFTLPESVRPVQNCFLTLWGEGDVLRIVNLATNGIVAVGGTGVSSWFNSDAAIAMWGTITYTTSK